MDTQEEIYKEGKAKKKKKIRISYLKDGSYILRG